MVERFIYYSNHLVVMKAELFTKVLEMLIRPYNSLDHGNLRKTYIWQKEENGGWKYAINYDNGFGSTKTLFIMLYKNGCVSFGDLGGLTDRVYSIKWEYEKWIRTMFGLKNLIPKRRIQETISYLKENHSDNPLDALELLLKDENGLKHTEEEIEKIRGYLKAA